jgi:uncharacterized protein YrrD
MPPQRLPRRLEMGQPVSCSDGEFGQVQDLVVDPEQRRITHLVVQPSGHTGRARLIPIELAQAGDARAVALQCTSEEALRFPNVQGFVCERLDRVPVEDPDWDVGVQDVLLMPRSEPGAFVEYVPDPDPGIVDIYDRIPKGEAEIRRSSTVSTLDGHQVGCVDGLVLEEGRITQLLVRRGHLWRRRRVAVPAEAVQSIRSDEVVIRLSKQELDALPRVPSSGG